MGCRERPRKKEVYRWRKERANSDQRQNFGYEDVKLYIPVASTCGETCFKTYTIIQ